VEGPSPKRASQPTPAQRLREVAVLTLMLTLLTVWLWRDRHGLDSRLWDSGFWVAASAFWFLKKQRVIGYLSLVGLTISLAHLAATLTSR